VKEKVWKFDLDNPEHARVFFFILKRMGRDFAYTGQGEDNNDQQICWAAKQMWEIMFGAKERPLS
jgi:hypothetical protein